MLFKKPPLASDDRRLSPRKTVALEGRIFLPGGRAVSCITVDVSQSGARVKLGGNVLLPERFELSIPPEASRRPARLVWRSQDAVGIQYLDG
ncbi:PilZ domain-containing protein [Enterovirga sp.]|uniref:PilZ domain-containing protein n=1 Tax=Enterovirga sp. TaxID=2026350 RepID=UPI00261504D1|nr:PilZ domain-containing protein [Enterovirga sp.]MDB5589801.1 pilus assembly protein PilZ [Enterovirga sp.]